jgi:hypothetical protein
MSLATFGQFQPTVDHTWERRGWWIPGEIRSGCSRRRCVRVGEMTKEGAGVEGRLASLEERVAVVEPVTRPLCLEEPVILSATREAQHTWFQEELARLSRGEHNASEARFRLSRGFLPIICGHVVVAWKHLTWDMSFVLISSCTLKCYSVDAPLVFFLIYDLVARVSVRPCLVFKYDRYYLVSFWCIICGHALRI